MAKVNFQQLLPWLFDQINTVLVSIRDIFQKKLQIFIILLFAHVHKYATLFWNLEL